MQLLATKRWFLIAVALGVIGASIFFLKPSPGEKKENKYLFVVDARANKAAPLDLSKLAAEVNGNPSRIQVIVRPFDPSQIIDFEAAVARADEILQRQRRGSALTSNNQYVEFNREQAPLSELFFINLDPPYRETKQALRHRIDQQERLKGADRVWLMRRIVPVLRLSPDGSSNDCQQMKDDIVFIDVEFFGVVVSLDEPAISLLRSCKPF